MKYLPMPEATLNMHRYLLLLLAVCVQQTSAGNELVDLYLAKNNNGLPLQPLLPQDRALDNSHLAPGLWDIPDSFLSWDFEGGNYPRPREEANNERQQCNTNTASLVGASVCDTNGTLSASERESLQGRINSTLDSQQCQCSSSQGGCITSDKVAGGRYSIAIAIPEYLSLTGTVNNRCAQTRIETFANNLRSNRYKSLQRCDDGIVIALSPADQVYTISAGSKALKRLSSGCQTTIKEKVKPLIDVREYSTALHDMVDYINHALKGGRCGEKSGLTYDQVVGIICGVVFGTLFIVFMIVVCVGFFRNWKCVAGTCLGIIIGACLRAVQVAINLLIIKCMSAICERFTSMIPACEGNCDCCQCEPLTCVEDVEAGGGGGGGW